MRSKRTFTRARDSAYDHRRVRSGRRFLLADTVRAREDGVVLDGVEVLEERVALDVADGRHAAARHGPGAGKGAFNKQGYLL